MKEKKEEKQFIKAGGQSVEITHGDKIIYPKDKLSKLDIASYYLKIANTMLPHAKDRVISMQHFPDGIKGENFYQKRVPDYFPSWIKTIKVKLHEAGGSEEVVVVEKPADLVYLANQTVLPFHLWLSRINKINNPDKIVFDLDPPRGGSFKSLRFAAEKIKEKFEKMHLSVFIMTTGAHGFHVCIPINPTKSFDEVRKFTHEFATELAKEYPKQLTTETHIASRRGRIFIDYLRNSYGQTSVCPYSLRAIDGAPIAAPFRWSELGRINPQSVNIKNLSSHLKSGDPWKNFEGSAKTLK